MSVDTLDLLYCASLHVSNTCNKAINTAAASARKRGERGTPAAAPTVLSMTALRLLPPQLPMLLTSSLFPKFSSLLLHPYLTLQVCHRFCLHFCLVPPQPLSAPLVPPPTLSLPLLCRPAKRLARRANHLVSRLSLWIVHAGTAQTNRGLQLHAQQCHLHQVQVR